MTPAGGQAATMDGTGTCSVSARLAIPGDWPNRTASRFVELAHGPLHVQRAGSGPALVLLHGTGSATHTWRYLLPLLAADFDVIAPDLTGHGFSPLPPDGNMTLERLTDVIVELIRRLDVDVAALVGHSAGAAIGLAVAQRLPRPSSTLFAINGAFEPFGGPLSGLFTPLARAAAAMPLLPAMISWRARSERAVRRVLANTGAVPPDEVVLDYVRVLRNERHVSATMRMMAQWDLRPLLGSGAGSNVATHLLVGERDRAVPPAQARRYCARYPESRLTLLAGAGHLAHEEMPGYVSNWIRTALGKVPGRGD